MSGRGQRLFLLIFSLGLLVGCAQPDATPAATVVSPTPTLPLGVSLATHTAPAVAVVQVTPSPLPTATVTPTATPIVVAIEAGDTLLAIALARGTTVDEILRLNPGVQPEQLQIGQLIQLPPPATVPALALNSGGTAVPLRVVVTQFWIETSPAGSVWLLGELENQGAQAVENVRVTIDWVDAEGTAVRSFTAWSAQPVIAPGAAAPFGLTIAEPLPETAQPMVTVSGGSALVTAGSRYFDLTVTQAAVSEAEGPGGRVMVAGEVQNSGDQPAQRIELVAALYDTADRLVGFQQALLPDALPVGETAVFSFAAAPPAGEPVRVQVMAHGILPNSE